MYAARYAINCGIPVIGINFRPISITAVIIILIRTFFCFFVMVFSP